MSLRRPAGQIGLLLPLLCGCAFIQLPLDVVGLAARGAVNGTVGLVNLLGSGVSKIGSLGAGLFALVGTQGTALPGGLISRVDGTIPGGSPEAPDAIRSQTDLLATLGPAGVWQRLAESPRPVEDLLREGPADVEHWYLIPLDELQRPEGRAHWRATLGEQVVVALYPARAAEGDEVWGALEGGLTAPSAGAEGSP